MRRSRAWLLIASLSPVPRSRRLKARWRSEEHTSELQSLAELVCRLLLEKNNQADTPDVVYLEGVWVNPSARSQGIGRKCLRQLCQDLLTRTMSVCVLVNEENERTHTFYRMCNFKMRGI